MSLTGFPKKKKKMLEPRHEKCSLPVSQSKNSLRVHHTRGTCYPGSATSGRRRNKTKTFFRSSLLVMWWGGGGLARVEIAILL